MYNSGRGRQASHVAHNWAHQNPSTYKKDTEAGSLYYRGRTIYSYGSHFPIATISRENSHIVYFTTRGYSVTTSAHINTVRPAVNHKTLIYCAYPDLADEGSHIKNIQQFEYEAKNISKNLPKSKKPEIYLSKIAHQRDLLNKYAKHFNLDLKQYALVYIYIESKDGQSKASEAEKIAIEKAEKARQKELEKKHKKEVKEFRTFKRERIYTSIKGSDYLRFNKKTKRVETSQGVEIPAEIARRFYKWIKSTIKAGGCSGECTQKILNYEVRYVNANEMQIGCHTISMGEVESIAKLLNW